MTKKIFTLLLAILFMAPAFAQQVEEVQRLVITKRTATWCSNCGNWGWTFMENLIADNADKAILIAAHEEGSSLSIPAAEDITANWGSFAQPSFFVNEVNQGASPSNISTKRTEVKEMVDEAFTTPPVANVGFTPVFQNGEITVDAKVKFFQEATGDFYLGIYLLEDNVQASQAGSVSDDNHKRVMQFSFTNGSWGHQIVEGNVSAGTEFTQSYSLSIAEVDGYDYHVVGIIYDLDGGVYKPVNAWSTTEFSETSAVSDVKGLIDFNINPTIVNAQATIQLDLTNSLTNASLDIYNLMGKNVASIFRGDLSSGNHSFDLNREMAGGSGMYFVRLTDGQQVSTKRVIFH